MTYYIRYALVDPAPISPSEISDGLQKSDPDCMIDGDMLVFKDEEYGQVNITSLGDNFFADELELMAEFAEQDDNNLFLLNTLRKVTSVVLLQVLWSGRDENEVRQVIERMFDWLMQNREGLLIDEGGSFYFALSQNARE